MALKLNPPNAFVYFGGRGLGLGLVRSGFGLSLGLVTFVFVLVLRTWSCLHHCRLVVCALMSLQF